MKMSLPKEYWDYIRALPVAWDIESARGLIISRQAWFLVDLSKWQDLPPTTVYRASVREVPPSTTIAYKAFAIEAPTVDDAVIAVADISIKMKQEAPEGFIEVRCLVPGYEVEEAIYRDFLQAPTTEVLMEDEKSYI